MNIEIPVWSIPLGLTILFLLFATLIYKTGKSNGDYSGFGNAILMLFYGGLATVLSLIVWLIYFIIF